MAVILQWVPVSRSIASLAGIASSPAFLAIRWIVGSAAVAGSFHGVSAASSITPSSVSATNQLQFTQRFIVNDNTSTLYGNARSYTAVDLPPGLTILQTGVSKGIVTGIPTQPGTYSATIVGWSSDTPGFGIEHFQSPHQVVFHVLPGGGGPPLISTEPHSIAVHAGEPFSLTVEIQASGPVGYQWMSNNLPIRAWTNGVLSFTNPVPSMTGNYSVRVSNSSGSATSQAAAVLVAGPLQLLAPDLDAQHRFGLHFIGLTNRLYAIETSASPNGGWSLTGASIQGTGGTNTVWLPTGNDTAKYSHIKTVD